jgi:energy-coupling factor transporter ATP-binding protein EcfA2
LETKDFRCFRLAKLDLQFPGRNKSKSAAIPNVNLILGDNGQGKSSLLRALALTPLAPVISQFGFIPYRLVRRPGAKIAWLDVRAVLDRAESKWIHRKSGGEIDLTIRIRRRSVGSVDDISSKQVFGLSRQILFDDRGMNSL